MCDPVTITLTAISAAASAASTVTDMASAAAQQKDFARYQTNQTNATMSDFANNINQTGTRYAQEVEAANQQAQEVYLTNLQQKATAQASAAGSGVTGNSIDALFMDYDRATAVSDYMTEKNLRNQGIQYNEDMASLRARAITSLNQSSYYTGDRQSTAFIKGIGGILSSVGTGLGKKKT